MVKKEVKDELFLRIDKTDEYIKNKIEELNNFQTEIKNELSKYTVDEKLNELDKKMTNKINDVNDVINKKENDINIKCDTGRIELKKDLNTSTDIKIDQQKN